jgi:hypothetical protein
MAAALGKRKREIVKQKSQKVTRIEESPPSSAEGGERLKAILQRHFEAQFKPLPEPRNREVEVEVVEAVEEDPQEDWDGFSSEDEGSSVQVIEFSEARTENAEGATTSRKEFHAFLSGKVPLSTSTTSGTTAKKLKDEDEDNEDDDKINLKNDLALQRLLSESHLLDSAHSANNLEASGKNRLRALDIRMQSLGAKSSVFDGGKMPMNMRKGILAHRQSNEERRRSEAKENGIILEKEKRIRKFDGKRERGVGGSSVGKYKGGMLTLSKRDVRTIEGPKDTRRGGKKKGRR